MFGWLSNRNTLKDVARYAQSLQYFASKCIAHSTDNKPLIYDANKVRKDVEHYLDEHDYTEDGFKKKKQEDNPTEFVHLTSVATQQKQLLNVLITTMVLI